MKRGLARVVNAAEDIRHYSSQTTRLHNRPLRGNELGRKRFAELHDGIHIRIERRLNFFRVNVQRGDCIVAAGIVVEDGKVTAGEFDDARVQGGNGRVGAELEGKVGYVWVGRGVLRWVADCGEDVEACRALGILEAEGYKWHPGVVVPFLANSRAR